MAMPPAALTASATALPTEPAAPVIRTILSLSRSMPRLSRACDRGVAVVMIVVVVMVMIMIMAVVVMMIMVMVVMVVIVAVMMMVVMVLCRRRVGAALGLERRIDGDELGAEALPAAPRSPDRA